MKRKVCGYGSIKKIYHRHDVNERLKEIQKRKLRQKVNYLRTELEETQMIFEDSLQTFTKDFSEYFEKKTFDAKKEDSVVKDVEYDIPKEVVNKVFKKIATKTHPDKLVSDKYSDEQRDDLVELYKEAQKSVESKDWSRVVEIADELDIDTSDVVNDDSDYIEISIGTIESKIKNLKQTYAWIWAHTQEQHKESVKKEIVKSLGLNKENKNEKHT